MKRILLLLCWLIQASLGQAQAPAADIILRSDGNEVVGRVVAITPLVVRYLPPASAETLRLASADVFLIRYANGTREVLHSATAPATASGPMDLLPGLSEPQRRALGQRNAASNYTDQSAFWVSLGATLYAGPTCGVIAPAVIAPHAVSDRNLRAPKPALLADPAYGNAYRQEAQHHKRSRAWAGYGVGVGVWVLLIGALVSNI